MMFQVELRVAGALDPSWVIGGLPGFTTDPAPPITIIHGVLGPGEDLPDILGILRRHGVVPVDLWVDTFTTGA